MLQPGRGKYPACGRACKAVYSSVPFDLVQDDLLNDDWADGDPAIEYVKLTPEQVAGYNRDAARTLIQVIAVQLGGAFVVALISGLVAGWSGAASALAGAASNAIPNVLFATRLLFGMLKPGGTSPLSFFVGEFLKLASTAFLLLLVAKLGQDELVWPAVLAGLIVALKGHYWLLLLLKGSYSEREASNRIAHDNSIRR